MNYYFEFFCWINWIILDRMSMEVNIPIKVHMDTLSNADDMSRKELAMYSCLENQI